MEQNSPDLSVLKAIKSVSPPDWLETRTVSRAMQADLMTKSGHAAFIWKYFALGVLIIHLASLGFIWRSELQGNDTADHLSEASLLFSSDTYSYSW
ncbi:MAG: hypothetical protein RLZZ46_746 [Bacteroidota bacterium]|jgi:hypothetical protein